MTMYFEPFMEFKTVKFFFFQQVSIFKTLFTTQFLEQHIEKPVGLLLTLATLTFHGGRFTQGVLQKGYFPI